MTRKPEGGPIARLLARLLAEPHDGRPEPARISVRDRIGEVSWASAPTGVTLWGVYGPDCFPTVFACRLTDDTTWGRVIWGFSVHEGVPGFRTLGQGWEWAALHDLRLFRSREAAFAHIETGFPGA